MRLGATIQLEQLAPERGDSAAVLIAKQHKLLFIQQVFEAWIGRADGPLLQGCRAYLCNAVTQPEQQDRGTQPAQLQPHPHLAGDTSVEQQQQQQQQHLHQVPPACRLLGTDSTEDTPAGHKQQQSDQGQGSELQQPEQHDVQQAQHSLPPAFAIQQPASHKELLAHLLMPAQAPSRAAAAAAAAVAAAASIAPRAQQQQQQGARRLRRLPQGRRSMLGATSGHTLAGHEADAALEDSPGPIQQQQLLHMRAQYLLDAQSQAAGAAAATAAAAAPAAGLPGYAVNAHQQLFSPRTATHAPAPERASSDRSRLRARSSDVSHHGECGHQHKGDVVQQPDALQQQGPQLEQPEEIEVTPAHPRRAKATAALGVATLQQQQHWGSGAALTRGAITGPTGAGVTLLPATAATPEVLLDAGTGITSLPADDTPAADVTTGLIAAAGSHRAAAAAAAGLAAALFHTPGPHAAGARVQRSRGVDTPQPGTTGDSAPDLPSGQRTHHRQAGLGSMADAVELTAGGDSAAAAGSSRTLWLDLQQRPVRELHVGLPVMHILCCTGYAAVLLQDPAGPSTYRLLLLHMQRTQQQGLTGKQQQQLPNLQAQAVALTAESATVRLHSAQQPPLPAAAAACSSGGIAQHAQKQQPHSSQQQLDMLRTGLLLLPAGAGPCSAQQAGPYLAVASDLQMQPGPHSCEAHPAAAADKRALPCLPRHASIASSSKGKRKLPRAAGATQVGGIDMGARGSSCAVKIFQLHSSSQAAQHKSPGASLVQSLPTAHAVRCLAACAELPLLAAAGAAGFACVWPLLAQQQQQGTESAAHPEVQGHSSTTTGRGGSSVQPVVDASAAVVLPAASYRGIAFPDMQEVCFVVQGQAPPNSTQRSPLWPGGRVLLVGCCSQGPIAVWDVGLRQQIIALHCPDQQLSFLAAAGPAIADAAVAAALQARQASDQAAGAACDEQLAVGATPPVVFVAAVQSRAGSGTQPCLSWAQQEQEQHKQLRAVVLHDNGDMQLSSQLLAGPNQSCSVQHWALGSDTAAAAVTSEGDVQVWDMLTGMHRVSMRACSKRNSTAGLTSAALLPLSDVAAKKGSGCPAAAAVVDSNKLVGPCMAVLTGSRTGVLMVGLS